MSARNSDDAETIKLGSETLTLPEVAERMEHSIEEEMTPELKQDIVERLEELITLRCPEHDEAPELVTSDEQGLRVETCCHELMDRVNELWSS